MLRKKLMLSAMSATCLLAMGADGASAQTVLPQPNAIRPLYGNITPFYGNISPFYGNISPFWGNISPFWGNISPFYGNITPFWGNITPFYGNISPFYGNIAPFWEGASPVMERMRANWAASQNGLAVNDLRTLISQAESFWGASVTSRTGQTFQSGFVAPLLARHGINLANPATLSGFTDARRAAFLFDWYDGLMAFSGRDHVDYWMSTVRWNPALARAQGGGQGVVIGMFDFTPTGSGLGNVLQWRYEGFGNPGQGHGSAVASLLVADHDGVGLMGLAPNAVLAGYNPFDASGTASWDSIAEGVFRLKSSGASVVNLSLGVPGMTFAPEWNGIYSASNVKNKISDVLFVHAAGNDGLAQTQNINWSFALDPTFLVVGSVGPTGVISQFSNTPGTACLMDNGTCRDRLMNRFIVAPGEWILTSNGVNGVTRQSGTSFAAPQVTGAVALLQGRWPWLKNNPRETANIILSTARDLGAPGVDPVYGRGLLDVTAAQSPLNLANLYQLTSTGQRVALRPGVGGALLGASNGFVTVYEDVGQTFRDFIVPLNASLTNANTASGQAVQGYLLNALNGLGTLPTSTTSTTAPKTKKKFSDDFANVTNPFGWDMRANMSPLPTNLQPRDGDLPYAVDLALAANNGMTLFAGRGYGAVALSGATHLEAPSFQADQGGMNPILGLASGGAYVAVNLPLSEGLNVSAGFTQRQSQAFHADRVSGEERALFDGLDTYRATAANVSVRQQLMGGVAMTAAYTFLREDNGLLGLQSLNPAHFESGTQTDAATLGAEWTPNTRLSIAASLTTSRARTQSSADQALAVAGDGVRANAFEARIDLSSVLGQQDRAYLRLAQPLHVQAGDLALTNIEVIDRETGERGPVTQRVALDGGERQYLVEGGYVAPLFDGRGEVAALLRLDASQSEAEPVEQMIGGRFRLSF